MNMTRKILLVTENKEISEYVRISALTLTKLNVQVELIISDNLAVIEKNATDQNLDTIFLDLDFTKTEPLELIRNVRSNELSKKKKILCFYNGEINRDEVFKAGCDSIMEAAEFKRVVSNILQF